MKNNTLSNLKKIYNYLLKSHLLCYNENNIEKCKSVMDKQQLIPLFSIKNDIISSFLFLPWLILLIIVGIIIII